MPKQPKAGEVAPEAVVERPGLAWSTVYYRVRASDQRAQGGAFSSALLGSLADAWAFADWLNDQGGRFTLIRIVAEREAMCFPPKEEAK